MQFALWRPHSLSVKAVLACPASELLKIETKFCKRYSQQKKFIDAWLEYFQNLKAWKWAKIYQRFCNSVKKNFFETSKSKNRRKYLDDTAIQWKRKINGDFERKSADTDIVRSSREFYFRDQRILNLTWENLRRGPWQWQWLPKIRENFDKFRISVIHDQAVILYKSRSNHFGYVFRKNTSWDLSYSLMTNYFVLCIFKA